MTEAEKQKILKDETVQEDGDLFNDLPFLNHENAYDEKSFFVEDDDDDILEQPNSDVSLLSTQTVLNVQSQAHDASIQVDHVNQLKRVNENTDNAPPEKLIKLDNGLAAVAQTSKSTFKFKEKRAPILSLNTSHVEKQSRNPGIKYSPDNRFKTPQAPNPKVELNQKNVSITKVNQVQCNEPKKEEGQPRKTVQDCKNIKTKKKVLTESQLSCGVGGFSQIEEIDMKNLIEESEADGIYDELFNGMSTDSANQTHASEDSLQNYEKFTGGLSHPPPPPTPSSVNSSRSNSLHSLEKSIMQQETKANTSSLSRILSEKYPEIFKKIVDMLEDNGDSVTKLKSQIRTATVAELDPINPLQSQVKSSAINKTASSSFFVSDDEADNDSDKETLVQSNSLNVFSSKFETSIGPISQPKPVSESKPLSEPKCGFFCVCVKCTNSNKNAVRQVIFKPKPTENGKVTENKKIEHLTVQKLTQPFDIQKIMKLDGNTNYQILNNQSNNQSHNQISKPLPNLNEKIDTTRLPKPVQAVFETATDKLKHDIRQIYPNASTQDINQTFFNEPAAPAEVSRLAKDQDHTEYHFRRNYLEYFLKDDYSRPLEKSEESSGPIQPFEYTSSYGIRTLTQYKAYMKAKDPNVVFVSDLLEKVGEVNGKKQHTEVDDK